MGFTNNLTNNLLNHVFRNKPYTSPETLYVGLLTSNEEVSAGEYKRQQIEFNEPSGGVIKNSNEARFPIATSDWGKVTGLAIYDAESGGNKLDELTVTSKEVTENEQPFVPVEGYEIEVKEVE